jgi:hypothetical protein
MQEDFQGEVIFLSYYYFLFGLRKYYKVILKIPKLKKIK